MKPLKFNNPDGYDSDDSDDLATPERPKLWKKIKIKDKASCLRTLVQGLVVLIGLIMLLIILYQAGIRPWSLTRESFPRNIQVWQSDLLGNNVKERLNTMEPR